MIIFHNIAQRIKVDYKSCPSHVLLFFLVVIGNTKILIVWKRLYAVTVPVNKKHITGTVPANKEDLTGSPWIKKNIFSKKLSKCNETGLNKSEICH